MLEPFFLVEHCLFVVFGFGQGGFEVNKIKRCFVLAVEEADDIRSGIEDGGVFFLHVVYSMIRLKSKQTISQPLHAHNLS